MKLRALLEQLAARRLQEDKPICARASCVRDRRLLKAATSWLQDLAEWILPHESWTLPDDDSDWDDWREDSP